MDKEKEGSPLKQIRTFQGDVAEALKKQRESLVSIQRAEQQKRGGLPTSAASSANAEKKKEFFYLFLGSIVLFILGATGVWYAYDKFIEKTASPAIATPVNRFIPANKEINIDLATTTSREIFIGLFSDAVKDTPTGELRHVVLRKVVGEENALLNIGEFFNILENRSPGSLVRAFNPLFMLGALGDSTFLIIKLVSFENAFAGMLAWEKVLSQDIGPLFAANKLLANSPIEPVFKDVVDKNKDIRILMLDNQQIILYSFLDNETLIITDKIESLRTIINRLTQEKLSR